MKVVSHRFSSACSEGVIVLSQEPCRRTIRMEYENDDWNDYSKKFPNFKFIDNYYLSFPTVLFSIRYLKSVDQSFEFYWLDLAFSEPIKSRKPKIIYLPALSNVSEDLRVCINIEDTIFDSLDKMSKHVVNSFWQTQFNDTLLDTSYVYEEREGELKSDVLLSLPSWREKTKQDKSWIPTKKDMLEVCEESYVDEFWGNSFPRKKLSF
jgi:hypothetical protein